MSCRWWLLTLAWCLAVVASAAAVLLVSHARGGLLAARPAARLEVHAAPRPIDLAPLRAEIAACRDDVERLRWQVEAALPTAWPKGRERLPVIPAGAATPTTAATLPVAGSARKWRRDGWDR